MRGKCSTWSTFKEVRGSPATSDDFGRRLVLHGRRSTWSTSGSFCVAGAALGAPRARFAWQAQHLEHLLRGPRSPATSDDFGRRFVFHGRRSTWSTSVSFLRGRCSLELRFVLRGTRSTWPAFIEVGGSQAKSDDFGRHLVFAWQAHCLEHLRFILHLEHLRLVLRGRRSTWSTSGSFCVAGAALGAPPARFAWQAQHLEYLRFVLCGRGSTWSTFIEVGGSLATSDDFGRRVAGAALGGASPARFAWQAQHMEYLRFVLWQAQHLHRGPRKSATSDDFGRRLVLHGRRSTWSTSGSFCVAGAALGACPARFAGQAQHEHLRCPRKSGDFGCRLVVADAALGASSARFAWQVQHLEHLLRGPRKSGDE